MEKVRKMVKLFFIRSLHHYYEKVFSILDPKVEIIICDRYITSAEVFINTLCEQELITEFDKEVLKETLKDYLAMLPKSTSGWWKRNRTTHIIRTKCKRKTMLSNMTTHAQT